MATIDSRTGRPPGDHGEAHFAIDFALDNVQDHFEREEFLKSWREGGAFEDWPEFYPWLKNKETSKS